MEEDIRKIIPKDRTAAFTQSLMELGALVCIPNGKPLCMQCPVMHLCRAFHEGNTGLIPCKPDKKKRRVEEMTVYLLEHDGKYAVRKRSEEGLLAGMWEFPHTSGYINIEKIHEQYPSGIVEKLKNAKHIFSHIEWHMTGYLIQVSEESPIYEWKFPDEIKEQCAIPSAFEAYYKLLTEK